jgi:signal transduction histidine kinase/ActR/RegA family two-component response regulator
VIVVPPSSWREGMLRALLLTFSLAGMVAYVPGAVLNVRAGTLGLLAVETILYLVVLAAFFLPRLGFGPRALMMLGAVYTLGVGLLVVGGPFGTGALWLFSVPVLAGALLDLPAAVITLLLNLVTLAGLWLAAGSPMMAPAGWASFPPGTVPILIGNFVLLDTAAALSVALLVRRLEEALFEERTTRGALDVERRELVALNELVSREMEDRVRADRVREALEDQLRQSQKMEAIGRLAGGVAHDFNNLLTAILGHVSLALRGRDDPVRLRRRLEEIERAGGRASELTQQLLALSRKQVLQPRVIDLNECVREMEGILVPLVGEDVELDVELAPGTLAVRADPTQLQQVIMNLAVNARDAMPSGGRLRIETSELAAGDDRPPDVREGRLVALVVSDNGIGMDAETRQHAFEPFFTTKRRGHGTGLGLATVYGIVTQSDGTVTLDSAPGKGATFRILLPGADQPLPAQAPRPPASEAPGGRETILLVEDEDLLRTMTVEVLGELGYTVLAAESGRAALRRSAEVDTIHLVLSDVVMPEMGGREAWLQVSRQHPEARVLFMSGYTDDAIVRHGVREAEVSLLNKPFTPDELARRVRAVLDGPPAAAGPLSQEA